MDQGEMEVLKLHKEAATLHLVGSIGIRLSKQRTLCATTLRQNSGQTGESI